MKNFLRLPVICIIFLRLAVAAQTPTPRPFKDGERVCFIGDSITHGGLYHSYISLFYATRFPKRSIKTFNCGISGDSAGGALRRFEWDIAANSPSVSTIMIGMNDVNHGLYGRDNLDEKNLARRQTALDHYSDNMREIARQLKAINSEIIFITPSIYDETCTIQKKIRYGVNDALGICGERARALASEFGGSVVDFHGAMQRVNAEYQKVDSTRTIVGGDRIHPGPMGHLIMAYIFLKAQGISPFVSAVAIDACAGKVSQSHNVEVSGVFVSADTIRFSTLANALPFPIPSSAEEALDIVPFMQDLNQQTLTINGLSTGTYTLAIDGHEVGEYTAQALSESINLAGNKQTPQYKQAQTIAEANAKRHSLIVGKLRSFALTETYLKSQKHLDLSDFDAIKKTLQARVTKMREQGREYAGYYDTHNNIYINGKPQEDEYKRQIQEAADFINANKHPVKHQFALQKK